MTKTKHVRVRTTLAQHAVQGNECPGQGRPHRKLHILVNKNVIGKR